MTYPSNLLLIDLGREVSMVDIAEITQLLQDKYGLSVDVSVYEPDDDLPLADEEGII